MRRRNAAIAGVLLSVSAVFVGRGWWKAAEEAAVVDESFDVMLPLEETVAPPQTVAKPVAAVAASDPRLQIGDTFSFLKTVEQKIAQPSPTGVTQGRSLLELVVGLRVEEIRDRQKRIQVRYHQAKYEQDIGGELVAYDSRTSQEPVPVAVRAYQGLVNNGFDLWLDADNRPAALDGFDNFLRRCVRDVPGEHRETFTSALVGMSQDDSIANFIDESIGLIPHVAGASSDAALLHAGAQWEQQRQIARPVPLYLTNHCTLRAIDEQTATIDIVGQIHPAPEWGANPVAPHEASVLVRGGHAVGHCIVNRQTGLPIESRMERNLDLAVRLKDGTSFDQQKYVLTTLKAVPNDASPSAAPAQLPTAATVAPPAIVPPTATPAGVPPAQPGNPVINTSYETPAAGK